MWYIGSSRRDGKLKVKHRREGQDVQPDFPYHDDGHTHIQLNCSDSVVVVPVAVVVVVGVSLVGPAVSVINPVNPDILGYLLFQNVVSATAEKGLVAVRASATTLAKALSPLGSSTDVTSDAKIEQAL